VITIESIIRQVGALQRAGARVESITLHTTDADFIEQEMKTKPTSADTLDNKLGRLLFGRGHRARFWLHGYPVLVDDACQVGTVSIACVEGD
jgi:hypothetical protein